MRLDYTRQTRWAHDPEPLDPEWIPPGSIFVKQVLWVPCGECDLQVHAALTATVGSGVNCPECGGRLTSPRVLGNPDVAQARLVEVEEILRDSVEPGTPFVRAGEG